MTATEKKEITKEEAPARLAHVAKIVFFNALVRIDVEVAELVSRGLLTEDQVENVVETGFNEAIKMMIAEEEKKIASTTGATKP